MHTHSDHSHDAKIPMPQIYEGCRKSGIKIMAAADHYDGCFCADGPYDWSHIRNSNAEADELSARYPDGMVLRSIELGEPQWDAEQSRRVIAESNFDVVVGAIHAVKSPMFEDKQLLKRCFSQLKYDELTARQIYDLMDAYYRDNLEMVKTMDIDICAHLTCVVGYFMSRHGIFVGVEQFKPIIREILQVLIDKGIALEVNFSGYPASGITSPHQWIIQMYREMGGYLICMATDAHSPARTGAGYEQGVQLLKDMGFRHVFYYKNRKPVPCTLL
jgi:histidinol-phosphatase (PHP family)